MCVYSLSYPSCNAHASYCHPWPVRLYKIFPRYPIEGTFNKVFEHNMFFDLPYNFGLKYFSISEELSEIWSKMYIDLQIKYPLFLSDLNNTWIFSTDYWKMLKWQISWKSAQWKPTCAIWTDRHNEANCRFPPFANATKNTHTLSGTLILFQVTILLRTLPIAWRKLYLYVQHFQLILATDISAIQDTSSICSIPSFIKSIIILLKKSLFF
jgi:hypothetical protein